MESWRGVLEQSIGVELSQNGGESRMECSVCVCVGGSLYKLVIVMDQ